MLWQLRGGGKGVLEFSWVGEGFLALIRILAMMKFLAYFLTDTGWKPVNNYHSQDASD
jgi:hypothetical protein